MDREAFDDLAKQVKDLSEYVRENAISSDQAKEMAKEVAKSAASVGTSALPFSEGTTSSAGLSHEVQEYGDYMLIAKSMLEAGGRRSINLDQIRKNMLEYGVIDSGTVEVVKNISKGMGAGTSSYGLEWVPTQFSASLIDRVRLQLKVAALHGRIPMPTNPYKAPVVAADANAYLASENTSDSKVYLTASRPSTINVTWTAKKLATRLVTSDELTEDSIIPILPFLRDQAVNSLANAQEDATINGDTACGTGGAIDSDMQQAPDAENPRGAWMGYRKLVQAGAKTDCATFNTTNLRLIRKTMGKYGVNPTDLAWVCSIAGYNKFLGLAEVITVDKYGPNATLLSGELGRFDGIPIIVSEFVREDLNASGVFDGVTSTKTMVSLVYKPGFKYGDRRSITVRSKEDFETEQTVLAASQRLDFQPLHAVASNLMLGLGYNIAV